MYQMVPKIQITLIKNPTYIKSETYTPIKVVLNKIERKI